MLRTAGICFMLVIATALVSLQVACTAPLSSPSGAAADTGETANELEIDLLGTIHHMPLDGESRLITGGDFSSADGAITLSIDEDTQLMDKDGKPLASIRLKTGQEVLCPPEDAQIIGATYSLEPQDAYLDRTIRLTLSYDPEKIPGGVREDDIYIAPYDESAGWGSYFYKRVETATHRVTTQIEHLTTYAVLAPVKAPATQPAKQSASAVDLSSYPLEQALANGLPTLAEFGSSSCVPCKQMKSVLEELAEEYKDKLNVVVVEVYEQMELTRQYGIMTIPTQIFFDGSGEELNRHVGFYPKEEIVTRLQEMGVE